jgi:hypothetical protein
MNQHSRQRWFSLITVLVVAVLLTMLLQPLYSVLSEKLSDPIAPWPWLLQRAILVLMISGVWVVLIRLKGFRPNDLTANVAVSYPPTWAAAILGSCI